MRSCGGRRRSGISKLTCAALRRSTMNDGRLLRAPGFFLIIYNYVQYLEERYNLYPKKCDLYQMGCYLLSMYYNYIIYYIFSLKREKGVDRK